MRRIALSQAERLDDRHIQALQRLGHGIAPFGCADDKILQHDEAADACGGQNLGQAFDHLARGAAPAGQDLNAGRLAGGKCGAEGGGRAAIHVGQIEHDGGGGGGQA